MKTVLQKTVRGDFPAPAKRAPERHIPVALSAVAMKSMQVEPDERYPNIAALILDIHKYQDGFATLAENPTFITHTLLLVKRHKLAMGIIALALAVIALILSNSFASIKKSERIALDAKDLATQRLEELQFKNDYIETTAKKVAPDYLDLMVRAEREYEFDDAEQALDTGLAFDPELQAGWLKKGHMLLSQQKFAEAWTVLSGNHGHPVQKDARAFTLADKYKDRSAVPDADLPELVRDFKNNNIGIPRLFYHLNRAPFAPETRFPAIAESLALLNPKVKSVHFTWTESRNGGWNIDLSGNPDLDDISPLCGLNIRSLNASGTGAPDLKLITEDGMQELRLADTALNHIVELDQLAGLKLLDISGTGIRNTSTLAKYSKLTTLDISDIEGLTISPQLVWSRNLKMLTVSDAYRNDRTIKALANLNVIIIYTNH